MATQDLVAGLEGVVVAETKLSDVDGERGLLVIAGHDVERFAEGRPFEDAFSLLVHGKTDRAEAGRALGRARVAAFEALPSLGSALSKKDGMDALRASIAQVSPPDSAREPEALVGAMAVYAAAWARVQAGSSPIAPDPSLSHAADYLRMVRGERPSAALTEALDSYLLTVVDHGMNASTFAARVVASTGSDMTSSIVAALGALKGPLHGGAPGPVLDMLDAIGTPDRAAEWLEAELSAGRRIMGMGHRVYRVRDPRAAVLEKATRRLEQAGVSTGRLDLARAIETAAVGVLRQKHPARALAANVEFYTAVLLDSIGLPRTLFTPTFAVGRSAGWCAHVLEQRATGRLIRPQSRYVGAAPVA